MAVPTSSLDPLVRVWMSVPVAIGRAPGEYGRMQANHGKGRDFLRVFTSTKRVQTKKSTNSISRIITKLML